VPWAPASPKQQRSNESPAEAIDRPPSDENPQGDHPESSSSLDPIEQRNYSIHPVAFLSGLFGILCLTKLSDYLTPYKLYFSFSSFFFDDTTRATHRWEALGIKLLIPFVVGFSIFYILVHIYVHFDKNGLSPPTLAYITEQAEITTRYSGFFSALLMAWPFLVYWDIMIRPDLANYRWGYLIVYILYALSYGYFCMLGVLIAKLYMNNLLPKLSTAGISDRLSWLQGIRSSFLGIVTTAIATFLATRLANGL